MGKTTPWVLATAFGALVILAVAWLFGASPRLDAAAEAREAAESEQSRIDTLEIQLAALEKDFANIEDFRTELADLRVQVPTDELIPDLIRQLQGFATGAGVVITNAISETPTTMTIVREEVIQPPAPAEGEEPAEGAAPAEPTVQEVATASAHYVVPLKIRTLGGFAETLSFLNAVQTGSPRVILVSDLLVTSVEEKAAEGGLPAIFDGWIDTEHTLWVIVLPDPDAVPPAPGPVPVPAPDAANPFTRLTVSGDIITGGVGPAAPPAPEAPEGEETGDEGTTEEGGEGDEEG